MAGAGRDLDRAAVDADDADGSCVSRVGNSRGTACCIKSSESCCWNKQDNPLPPTGAATLFRRCAIACERLPCIRGNPGSDWRIGCLGNCIGGGSAAGATGTVVPTGRRGGVSAGGTIASRGGAAAIVSTGRAVLPSSTLGRVQGYARWDAGANLRRVPLHPGIGGMTGTGGGGDTEREVDGVSRIA